MNITPTPTLETLASKAEARGRKLGEQDALTGVYMNEALAPKFIADIILMYMVFVEDMDNPSEEASEIEKSYLVSEFTLGYAIGFANVFLKEGEN